MVTLLSKGVEISVETFYQENFSIPTKNYYLFAYKINIANKNDFIIQILKRKWIIIDALGSTRTVEGEGVVGELPVILPNESYNYLSNCDFSTEIGKMFGVYLIKNFNTNECFNVTIPEFTMIAPLKLN